MVTAFQRDHDRTRVIRNRRRHQTRNQRELRSKSISNIIRKSQTPTRPRIILKLRNSTTRNDLTLIKNTNTITKPLNKLKLMRRKQHPNPKRRLLLKQISHRLNSQRIKPRKRLIQNKKRRLTNKRRTKLHPLLITQRQILNQRILPTTKTKSRDQTRCNLPRLRQRITLQQREMNQLILHSHPRIKTTLLRHITNSTPIINTDRPTIPSDLTIRRSEQPKNETHSSGLTRTIPTNESNNLTPTNCQVNTMQHLTATETPANSTQLKTKHFSLRKVVRFI